MGVSLISILKAICPKAKPVILAAFDHADEVFAKYEISTVRRQAHFLAQLLHESACLRAWEESLYYRDATRLVSVWPKRFPTPAAAAPYVRNPEALANYVYGGRMGNTAPGDGWKYRGRGLIQLTGRYNYEKYALLTGIPLAAQPELAASAAHALEIAACFWTQNRLNELADTDLIVKITRAINGGEHGLQSRRSLLVALLGKLK